MEKSFDLESRFYAFYIQTPNKQQEICALGGKNTQMRFDTQYCLTEDPFANKPSRPHSAFLL